MARARHRNPLAAMEASYGKTAMPRNSFRPHAMAGMMNPGEGSSNPGRKSRKRRAPQRSRGVRGRGKRSKTVTMRAKGKKPITFERGKLHRLLHVPEGEPIPASKRQAALVGREGPEAKKAAVFAFKGPLAAGRKKARRRK